LRVEDHEIKFPVVAKKGTVKKPHYVWDYYGTVCHPAASLMVSRCKKREKGKEKGDSQECH